MRKISPYYEKNDSVILNSDVLEGLNSLEDQSVNCCVTSPPYFGLRQYLPDAVIPKPDCLPSVLKMIDKNPSGTYNISSIPDKYQKYFCPAEIGNEETLDQYTNKLVLVFREVRRVLRDDGTLWLNLGDSYNTATKPVDSKIRETSRTSSLTGGKLPPQRGAPRVNNLKHKDLIGVPWRVAFALQDDGWYLRQDIIWAKGISGDACSYGWSGNPMPESVRDRCVKAHEYLFLLSKSPRYYYDIKASKESVAVSSSKRYKTSDLIRNRRSVWTIAPKRFNEPHFAAYPPNLVKPCIIAGCPEGGVVLDPFLGSGTTSMVARQENRKSIGIELNSKYCDMAIKRIEQGLD